MPKIGRAIRGFATRTSNLGVEVSPARRSLAFQTGPRFAPHQASPATSPASDTSVIHPDLDIFMD